MNISKLINLFLDMQQKKKTPCINTEQQSTYIKLKQAK